MLHLHTTSAQSSRRASASLSLRLFASIAALMLMCLPSTAAVKTCLDDGWCFALGHHDAVSADFNDSHWRKLSLPHDWSVEPEAAAIAGGTVVGPFTTNSVGKYQTGHTVGGEGWYRRDLMLKKADLRQRIELYFEGIYNEARVYVNGNEVAHNVYGYMSFRADITAQCRTGRNVIVVQVLNEGNNTRWYAGSGIYRHVWLIRSPRVYIDEWDTYIKATNFVRTGETTSAAVDVRFAVHNQSDRTEAGTVGVEILRADGTLIDSSLHPIFIAPHSASKATLRLHVKEAQLWSPETPYRYTARITFTPKKKSNQDVLTKHFGIRQLAFSATEGFLLNGVPTLLHGGCVHHDNGLLGAAAFDRAENRKLQLLKDNGFNAVRCSHNLPSEHFLEACDSIGLMVIDECFDQWLRKKNDADYHRFFATNSTADVQTMVRRDANHPSVIMWSIGNEIPGRIEPAGLKAAERLRRAILEIDDSRPITAAICGWDEGDEWNAQAHNWETQDSLAFRSLDVGGYNYLYDKYAHDHLTHPSRVMCGLESYPKEAAANWHLVETLPYVVGDFVWTAMDYLGEAGIGSAGIRKHGHQTMFQDWPWYNGWCGDIDLIGQKKPQSYYRDVVWHRAPITMAVERPIPNGQHQSVSAWGWQLEEQSWTYPDLTAADTMTVNVYSRSPRVRLYLNDRSLGDQPTTETYWTAFRVPYQEGVLRAVNISSDGTEVHSETFALTTTGRGVTLRVTYDKPTIEAATADLVFATIELVDAEGRVVTSDCTTTVDISNAGSGDIIATGTASPNDMHSFRSPHLTLFRGRALCIIRGNGKAGTVAIDAKITGV